MDSKGATYARCLRACVYPLFSKVRTIAMIAAVFQKLIPSISPLILIKGARRTYLPYELIAGTAHLNGGFESAPLPQAEDLPMELQ